MISFTPRPLNPGKRSRYPLDGKLGGLQSQSGRGDEDKSPFPALPPPGIEA